MSKASIEQALTGLIPTLNGPIPSELLDLALSLLTRSRSVANSLKSDEEIARPYACAQLACERLKKRLNLPTITSRPPCPPRIYKKLYAYLTSALPAPESTAEPHTPRKSKDAVPISTHNTPKTHASGRKTPRSTRGGTNTFEEAPEWVMPAIRSLVKALDYPRAAPHVYTGVETTLPLLARMSAAVAETPSKRGRHASGGREDMSDTQILGLIAAIFLYIYTRMKDVDVSPEQYGELRETVVTTLSQTPTGKGTTYEEILRATEVMMPMAHEEGWVGMEWYENAVPEGELEQMEGVEMGGECRVAGQGVGQGRRTGGSDYIGLGTMMQDATDYLGERQREDYKLWRSRIMARVQEVKAT